MNKPGIEKNAFYHILNTIINCSEGIETVFLFGSRARGDMKKESDIDLAVIFSDSAYKQILQDRLDELPIIYNIDLIDMKSISNANLKREIQRDGIVIYDNESPQKEDVKAMSKLVYKYTDFEKALSRLEEALKRDPATDDLVIDAVIQRFEFTYELAWKWMKTYMEFSGLTDVNSPRSTFRTAFQQGLISDGNEWIGMMEDRNRTSHTYDEETAKDIFIAVKEKYVVLFKGLFAEMTKRLDEMK